MRDHSVAAIVALLFAANGMAAAPDLCTVEPIASTEPLKNPGKGWVIGWYPWSNTPEDLAWADLGYTRFEWSEIEPEEGTFNWEPIDTLISSWAALGKQCAFGVMATSTGADKYVTPRWVFEAGAPVRIYKRDPEVLQFLVWTGTNSPEKVHGQETWEVIREPIDLESGHAVEVADYQNPVFLAKLRNFLKAMAARYDGNPNIAYIDIRSYLNWGEQFNRSHIELHLEIFKKTRLCQSLPHYGDYPDFDWCVQQGIAGRRDGIGGWSDGRECTRALGHAPAVFEIAGTYESVVENGWWREGSMLREAVETGKPTYVTLPASPGGFVERHPEESPLLEELQNRMGYHFVLEKAIFPTIVSAEGSATVVLSWRNKGVAPIYIPCVVELGLIDDSGAVVDRAWPTQCKPASWQPDTSVSEQATVRFVRAAPGAYRLCVGLFPYIGAALPTVRLGIKGQQLKGWHVLGKVSVDKSE